MPLSSRPIRAVCALGALTAALWTPVQTASAATLIDFEPLAPTIVLDGDVLTQDGYALAGVAQPGTPGSLVGAVDSASSCFVATCPTGNATSFYQGLNDSSLTLSRSDSGFFSLKSFDAGFLAAVPLASFAPGMLLLQGTSAAGGAVSASFAFDASDAAGNFAFKSYSLGAAFDLLRSVSFSACTYDMAGACVNPNENFSQFALDNLAVAAIPEPSTVLLTALGLAALALRARRTTRREEA